ncbi:hypothetical protein [Novipirellula rosea]|uniref:Uncharacterized protein n=1 Tax=Novipirellula rosea TaxID=1031540 RepID=A0ABP8NQL9_9BACT
MFKRAFLSAAILGSLGLAAGNASAQSGCDAALGQTYQRFSYSPAVETQPLTASSPVPMATMYQPNSNQGVDVAAPQVQSYRRFSYQPSMQARNRGATHKQPWQYPKTDPRRYRTH